MLADDYRPKTSKCQRNRWPSWCSDHWIVSASTSNGVTTCQPFKGISPAGKIRRGEMYGAVYAECDDAFDAMHAHGYGVPHGRNTCRLVSSPASKRHEHVGPVDSLASLHYSNGLFRAGYRLGRLGLSLHGVVQAIGRQNHPTIIQHVVQLDHAEAGWRAFQRDAHDADAEVGEMTGAG